MMQGDVIVAIRNRREEAEEANDRFRRITYDMGRLDALISIQEFLLAESATLLAVNREITGKIIERRCAWCNGGSGSESYAAALESISLEVDELGQLRASLEDFIGALKSNLNREINIILRGEL